MIHLLCVTGPDTGHEAVVRRFLTHNNIFWYLRMIHYLYLTLMALSVHEIMFCDTDIKPDKLSGRYIFSLIRNEEKF